MVLSDNAKRIVESRYLMYNEKSWEDVCKRVSTYVSAAEVIYTLNLEVIREFNKQLYDDLVQCNFIFNSPTLFNAGSGIDPELLYKPIDELTMDDYEEIYAQRNPKNSLSACFVIPVNNSIEEIFNAVKEASIISKAGGGVGYNFSHLSHRGRPLDSGVGKASGPLSFMEVFESAAQAVMQGGRRRAAQLGTLRYDHPDIMDFIRAKADKKSFKFFNLSVLVDDQFMKAVEEDGLISLVDPVDGTVLRTLPAMEIFDSIAEQAWVTGDPGLLFYDALNRDGYVQGKVIESTNPCGEIGTYFYGSCNLGHINLNNMVCEDTKSVNYDQYVKLIHRSIRYLDNIIDMNWYPLKEITRFASSYRTIGLGVMGLAHALFKLNLPYSPNQTVEELAKTLMIESTMASIELAKQRGPYPEYNYDVWIKKSTSQKFTAYENKNLQLYGIRNAATNTAAPTGTCALVADTSSGIEPVFSLEHIRIYIDKDGKEKELYVLDPVYQNWRDKHPTEPTPNFFVDASHISIEDHIKMQALWQQYIDQSISKTINMPNSATIEDVKKAYLLAYQLGCKGITIFRDGCRDDQVLSSKPKVSGIIPKPRPKVAYGRTSEVKIGCGTLYITINLDDNGKPIEAFITTGKGGGCRASSEGLGRMISVNLRGGIAVEEIIKQLEHIKCPSCVNKGNITVKSCPDAVAKELKSFVLDKHLQNGNGCDMVIINEDSGIKCEECGSIMVMQEGCRTCPDCGFSKCI